MSESELLATAARYVGEHALGLYSIGLVAVVVMAASSWAALGHPLWPAANVAPPPSVGKPSKLLWRGLAGLALILLAAYFFAEVAENIGPDGDIARADELLAATLRATLRPWELNLFATLTHFGDTAVLTTIAIAVALLLWLKRRRLHAMGWLMAVVGNALLNPALKHVFERARPLHDHGYTTESGFSFPSGHSSGSMVTYGMLCYLAIELLPPRWRLPSLLCATAIVFTTGCSRVFLQVHFASDVAAGFASGLAWLTVCILSLESMNATTMRRRTQASADIGHRR